MAYKKRKGKKHTRMNFQASKCSITIAIANIQIKKNLLKLIPIIIQKTYFNFILNKINEDEIFIRIFLVKQNI